MAGPDVSAEEHALVSRSHVGRYAAVWLALVLFTLLTWGLSRLHLGGGWGVVVVLAIATTKGTLVALFFMHLWDQRGANRLVFLTALVFVTLLIGLTILDNATRFQLANPPGSAGALPEGGAAGPPYAVPGQER